MNSALRPCSPRTLQTYEKALNTARTFAYYYFTDAQNYGFRQKRKNNKYYRKANIAIVFVPAKRTRADLP